MPTNTNSLTKAIVRYLNLNGFSCWKNYNGAVFSRKRDTYLKNPMNKLGVSDIIGFHKRTGLFIAVEVKVGADKPTREQALFIEDVAKAGGMAFIAQDSFDDFERKFQAWMILDALKLKLKTA